MSKKRTPLINFSKIEKFTNHELTDLVESYSKQINPIHEKISDDNYNHLTSYLVVRIVAVIDNSIRKLVQQLIDDSNLDVKNLFQHNEINLSLDELDQLKKNITKGKIISTNFNFQNPKEINFVLSNLLKLDFFDTLKTVITADVGDFFKGIEPIVKDFNNKFEELFKIFEIRNEIAHSLELNREYDIMYATNISHFALLFLEITIVLCLRIGSFRKGTLHDEKKLQKIFHEKSEIWKENHRNS